MKNEKHQVYRVPEKGQMHRLMDWVGLFVVYNKVEIKTHSRHFNDWIVSYPAGGKPLKFEKRNHNERNQENLRDAALNLNKNKINNNYDAKNEKDK